MLYTDNWIHVSEFLDVRETATMLRICKSSAGSAPHIQWRHCNIVDGIRGRVRDGSARAPVNQWPRALERLSLVYGEYNWDTIKDGMFPESLRYLSFAGRPVFNIRNIQSILKCIPQSLTSLDLGSCISEITPGMFPDSITQLTWGTNEQIVPGILPPSKSSH